MPDAYGLQLISGYVLQTGIIVPATCMQTATMYSCTKEMHTLSTLFFVSGTFPTLVSMKQLQQPSGNPDAFLHLEKPLIFFDLETTGLDCQKDRIVELSAKKIDPD